MDEACLLLTRPTCVFIVADNDQGQAQHLRHFRGSIGGCIVNHDNAFQFKIVRPRQGNRSRQCRKYSPAFHITITTSKDGMSLLKVFALLNEDKIYTHSSEIPTRGHSTGKKQ